MSRGSKFVEMILKEAKINQLFIDLEDMTDDAEFFNAVKKIRKKHDCSHPEKHFQKSFDSEVIEENGYRYYYLKNKKVKADKILYYFHGGAYIKGQTKMNLSMIQYFGRKAGCDIMIANYPLTPENTYKQALQYSVAGYQILSDVYNYKNIILLGDSAGGGLILSLLNMINKIKIQLPFKIILLSPWVDLTMKNVDIKSYEEHDYVLSVKGLIKCASYYAGDLPLDDSLISPIYYSYNNVPPIHLFVGGHEMFYPDCMKFVQDMKNRKQNITLYYYEDMCHDWLLFPFLEEGKEARKKVVAIINEIDH